MPVADPKRRVEPPGGAPPPSEAGFPNGDVVALVPLAEAVCTSYYEHYADEDSRYGPAGRAWCQHDNQYLLAWAAHEAVRHDGTLDTNIDWLCRVLAARAFPLERLRHDLELAAEVVAPLPAGEEVAAELRRAAERVATHAA